MDDQLYKVLHGIAQAVFPLAADSLSMSQSVLKNADRYAAQEAAELQAVNRGKAALQHNVGGANSSDELLLAGEPGLKFFQTFIPLYNEWTFANLDFEQDFNKPYRKLFGIDFAALRADGRNFQGAAEKLTGLHGELHKPFRGLVEHWRGDAAKAAGMHVEKFLQKAKPLPVDIDRIGRWTANNAEIMEGVIRAAATMTAGLYSADCGGHMPYAVDDMIKILRGKSSYPALNALSKVLDIGGGGAKSFAGLGGPAGQAGAAGLDLSAGVLAYLKKCLNEEFVKAFEDKKKVFEEKIIGNTNKRLETLWSEFDMLAKDVVKDPFGDLTIIVPQL
ncbi:WXG100 family type VII secretion target [Crossiella sp. NPDC003009]